MIFVAGATGMAGMEICRKLRAVDKPVRAFVRPTAGPVKLNELRVLGVELAFGDLKDPPSILHALSGAHSVISAVTATHSRQPGDDIETVDRLGLLALIDAARQSTISRFTLLSLWRHPTRSSPLTRAKAEAEGALLRSGLPYTVLACNFFAEMWLGPTQGLDYLNQTAVYFGTGDAPVSWISAFDAAEFAVKSLEAPTARNTVFAIGGPEPLSQRQVVALFEKATGKTFQTRSIPRQAMLTQLENVTDPFSEVFLKVRLEIANGAFSDNTEALAAMPIQQTKIRTYVDSVARR